jgi:hypothetical protein
MAELRIERFMITKEEGRQQRRWQFSEDGRLIYYEFDGPSVHMRSQVKGRYLEAAVWARCRYCGVWTRTWAAREPLERYPDLQSYFDQPKPFFAGATHWDCQYRWPAAEMARWESQRVLDKALERHWGGAI